MNRATALFPLCLAALLAAPARGGPAAGGPHVVRLVRGHLYGPGPLQDQTFKPGSLNSLSLAGFLKGTIPLLNHGGEGPNLEAESFHGKKPDGKLCDGTLINENVDVGNVTLMGQLQLLLAAVGGGPSGGQVNFYLDERQNWTILDDIAIDPGFANGVIKIENFTWSTSPRRLPLSIQTQRGYPGAVDRAGSKTSGSVLMGRLGDDDFDGQLDGVFNAIGNFPLTSTFLPGAPFAQTRDFQTDIPVTPLEAAYLTLAGARNELSIANDRSARRVPEADADELRKDSAARVRTARMHLDRARTAPGPARAKGGEVAIAAQIEAARRVERAMAAPAPQWSDIEAQLDGMVAGLTPVIHLAGGPR